MALFHEVGELVVPRRVAVGLLRIETRVTFSCQLGSDLHEDFFVQALVVYLGTWG